MSSKLQRLKKERQELKYEMEAVDALIYDAQKRVTHKCVWCGKRSRRKDSLLYIGEYYHDDVYTGYWEDTCAIIVCPKCGQGTRYYDDNYKSVIGNKKFFLLVVKQSDNGVEYHELEWRNVDAKK